MPSIGQNLQPFTGHGDVSMWVIFLSGTINPNEQTNKQISPCKRVWPFSRTNLNLLHPRVICAKYSWNWPSGSGEDEHVIIVREDRRLAIRKVHVSFQLMWAKKSMLITKWSYPRTRTLPRDKDRNSIGKPFLANHYSKLSLFDQCTEIKKKRFLKEIMHFALNNWYDNILEHEQIPRRSWNLKLWVHTSFAIITKNSVWLTCIQEKRGKYLKNYMNLNFLTLILSGESWKDATHRTW